MARFCDLVIRASSLLLLLLINNVNALASKPFTVPGGMSAKSEMCDPVAALTEIEVDKFIFTKGEPKWARPVKNARNPIDVSFRLVLSAIDEIVEKEKTVTFSGYLSVVWNDEIHIWNNTYPYACLDSLVIPAKQVWIPEVATVNARNHYGLILSDQVERIRIYSNGTVQYRPGGTFTLFCNFDLRYFPFDHQTCSLELESWRYTLEYQTLSFGNPPFALRYWIENDQWEITGWDHRTAKVSYLDPATAFDHIEFEIRMKRKIGYYLINVIIPSILISCAQLATFSLPVEEVMKIHVSFTCLLAYGVFQLMIITDMPRSSDQIPLLSIYIELSMAYITASMVFEGLVFICLRVADNKRYRRKMPHWLFAVASFIAVPFLVHSAIRKNSLKTRVKDKNGKSTVPPAIHLEDIETTYWKPSNLDEEPASSSQPVRVSQAKKHDAHEIEEAKWRLLADVIDRVTLTMYFLMITVTPISLFVILPRCTRNDQN